MRCPACGHEESIGDVCSQCATPLPVKEERSAPATSAPTKQPAKPTSVPPKEGKHRPRPLHDLDLTLPELEVQHLESPKLQKEKGKMDAPLTGSDRQQRVENAEVRGEASSKSGTGPAMDPRTGSQTGGRLDFSSFIFSVGASALMAIGQARVPGVPSVPGSTPPVDLVQARELIDLLGLLEEKTKGNLTKSESELLQQTLYSLRLKFIEVSKKT
ncbi:MAG: DUF1844 domain-containing protein [Nitrospirae bacterium]|nr:DUF1844 domain-containing protein [Nitrospirota bacterium]